MCINVKSLYCTPETNTTLLCQLHFNFLKGEKKQDLKGVVSQLQVLKVGVHNAGLKLFAPKGDTLDIEFPPNYGSLCTSWGLQQDCLSISYPLKCGFFSFAQCVGIAELVFRVFFPEEIGPHLAIDSVCLWEEVSSGSSYLPVLNQNFEISLLKSYLYSLVHYSIIHNSQNMKST